MLKCHCTPELEHCEPKPEENGVDYCRNAVYCFVAREIIEGQLVFTQGCREKPESCYIRRPDHASVSHCCNSSDYCNNEEMVEQLATMFPLANVSLTQLNVTSSAVGSLPDMTILYAAAAVLTLFLVFLIIFICRITRSKKPSSVLPSSRYRVSSTVLSMGEPLLTPNVFSHNSSLKHTASRLAYFWRCICFETLFPQESSPVAEMYYQRQTFTSNTSSLGHHYTSAESTIGGSLLDVSKLHRLTGVSNKLSSANVENEIAPEFSSSVLPTQQTYVDFTRPGGDMCEASISGSGSGRGQPLLVNRTIARSIELKEVIGRGRYGEVWRAQYCGEPIAVKIFASRDEASWRREAYIFNQTRLRHENIVNFVATDVYSRGSSTELWLIVAYHKHGSLFDYLMKNCIDLTTMLRFAASAARGLHHLHTSIGSKPAMAHRDIKSKNLLVKDDLTLCIADLGLVAIDGQESWKPEFGTNDNKVGTRRYMAPEMLILAPETQAAAIPGGFSALIRADIYSFALVLWELSSRLNLPPFLECSQSSEYQPPYYETLPPEPSVEDMCELVVRQGARPRLPIEQITRQGVAEFSSNANRNDPLAIVERFCSLIRESWDGLPENRPLTLLLKKTLCNLENENDQWCKKYRDLDTV